MNRVYLNQDWLTLSWFVRSCVRNSDGRLDWEQLYCGDSLSDALTVAKETGLEVLHQQGGLNYTITPDSEVFFLLKHQ